jgi:hypothetical protein
MHALQANYFSAYRSLKLTREANGVLVAEFHTNGGPLTFTAQDHTEYVDAFYRIAQDRANKIVILTGVGENSFPPSTFHRLATLPTRVSGVRCMTRASRSSKTSPMYAYR